MGFFESISQQLSNISKEISNAKKSYNDAVSVEKPGDWCAKLCIPSENCKDCIEERRLTEAMLKELETMEDYAESSPEEIKELMKSRLSKCTLCGAPIESGESACPYCDTEYPEGMISIDIPVSKAERKSAMLKKAEEAWGHSVKCSMISVKNIKEHPAQGFIGKLSGLAVGLADAGANLNKMDSSQIQQMAKQYNESLSGYLRGAISGTYHSFGSYKLEEERKRMNEQAARSRQIEAERQAKLSQIQNERHQRELGMIKIRTPQYSGGADRFCGNCRYFWGGNNCSNGGHTNGASDYCGCWALK